jgi:hypothetical protein
MEQRNSASSTGRRKSLKNVARDYCLAAKARRGYDQFVVLHNENEKSTEKTLGSNTTSVRTGD